MKLGSVAVRKSLVAAVLVAGATSPGVAAASGFATARFGGEHGSPVTTNPTAIYYNPAGIAASEGYHIFLDGNIAFRTATYEHTKSGTYRDGTPTDIAEPDNAVGGNTGKATLFNVVAAPMIGGSAKFGDFALGAGFFIPLGGASKWDRDEDFANHPEWPGPYDGEQRWYSIEGTLRTLYFTLTAAYQFKKIGLSLGVSGNIMRSSIHTLRSRTTQGDNDISTEGRTLANVGDWAWGFGVGALYEPIPKKLWIGASYQSRPNVAGGMKLDGDLTVNFTGAPDKPTPIEVHQDLPDIYRLGVKVKPREDLELRLFGDFTRWSALRNQCLGDEGKPCDVADDGKALSPSVIQNLPRNWDDTFGVRGGASLWLKPEIEVFTGLGYDGNAIPDETLDPALTDFDDISVALGGRVQVAKPLFVALSYTHFFYFSRDTTGENTLSLPDHHPDDADAPDYNKSRGPDAGGKYTQRVGVVNINLEAVF